LPPPLPPRGGLFDPLRLGGALACFEGLAPAGLDGFGLLRRDGELPRFEGFELLGLEGFELVLRRVANAPPG